jgi:DNA-binding transcriptional LysR family regulator
VQDLNDLLYFSKVVEAGGFSAAGRQLGLPKSRISRRIAELEGRLGVRLLQRSTRKLVLTEVGEHVYQHCRAMVQEANAAEQAVAVLSDTPRGRLRVSCPFALAQAELAGFLPEFLARYPEVKLDMLLVNRRVDLLEEPIDLALRVRPEGDEEHGLVVRRLRPAESVLVASPSLLDGQVVDTPDALVSLPALGAVDADRRVHWHLFGRAGESRHVAIEPRLAADDFVLRKAAAVAGLGVTLLPKVLCALELAEGRLVRLLPEWNMSSGSLQVVYAHRRGLLPAMRAMIDFLVEAYAREPGRPV